jgi:FkbM family methyltransferase
MELNFYSQQGEDIFIYKHFINQHVTDGVFIELGGLDGVVYSNTKFFEDTLGFNGILIEPIPGPFKNMEKVRTKSKCYNVAINSKEEPIEFIGNWATAGIKSSLRTELYKQYHSNTNTYIVPGVPISNIINENNLKYIDFLSIDVEGAERIVLETMNWNIEIYVICIELDENPTENDIWCKKCLEEKGFKLYTRLCGNEIWYNPNYSRRNMLWNELNNNITPIMHYLEPSAKDKVVDALINIPIKY